MEKYSNTEAIRISMSKFFDKDLHSLLKVCILSWFSEFFVFNRILFIFE